MDLKIDLTKNLNSSTSALLTGATFVALFLFSRMRFPNLGLILSVLLLTIFLINLLAVVRFESRLSAWQLDLKVGVKKEPINLLIAALALVLFILLGGHLVADGVACFYGRLSAC